MNKQIRIINTLTKEEQELLYFSEPAGYHTRLQQYLAYPQGFAARTTRPKSNISLSTTKAFRHYLRRFIRNFQPEPLLPGHALWLHLEKSGRFSIRLGEQGEEITDFCEGDFYVFQYICFLHIFQFWSDWRKCCNFPPTTLPILIQDFSEQLDKHTDYEALLRRAATIAAVVVVL